MLEEILTPIRHYLGWLILAIVGAALVSLFFGGRNRSWLKNLGEAVAVVLMVAIYAAINIIFMVTFGGYKILLANVIFLLIAVLLGMANRIFVQIPQNHVAAVIVGGIKNPVIVRYVVSTEEDLKKLTVDEKNPKGPTLNKDVMIAWAIPLLTKLFNIRIFSFNPFATLHPVEIFKNRMKTQGELEEQARREPDRVFTVEDRIYLAPTPIYVTKLRIDSVVNGYDMNVELRGNLKMNIRRQTNIRVRRLQEIYLTQHARYSSYVDETISAAHKAFLKTLHYNDGTTPDSNFDTLDISEGGSVLNKAIKDRIPGHFGSVVLSTTISDFELTGPVADAINNATASVHRLAAAENNAKGMAAEERERRLAAAAGDVARLKAYATQALSPEGRIALKALRDLQVSENLTAGSATRVFGTGATPMFDLDNQVAQPPTPPAPASTSTPPLLSPPTGTP